MKNIVFMDIKYELKIKKREIPKESLESENFELSNDIGNYINNDRNPDFKKTEVGIYSIRPTVNFEAFDITAKEALEALNKFPKSQIE